MVQGAYGMNAKTSYDFAIRLVLRSPTDSGLIPTIRIQNNLSLESRLCAYVQSAGASLADTSAANDFLVNSQSRITTQPRQITFPRRR
jgi:hypothetical protein